MGNLIKQWCEFKSNWQDWNRSRVNHFIHEFDIEIENLKQKNNALGEQISEAEKVLDIYISDTDLITEAKEYFDKWGAKNDTRRAE